MNKIYNLLVVITLVLVGGLVGITSANAEDYGLWVNGEQFTSEKTTINCGSGTAVFDKSSNTLTLNNATISKGFDNDGSLTGIYYGINKSLYIVINGVNNINSIGEGIYVSRDLNIKNNATLNINTSDGDAIVVGDYYSENECETCKLVLSGGEYNLNGHLEAGKLSLLNINGKIMVSFSENGSNAKVISKKELEKVNSNSTYNFYKIGNYKTYKIYVDLNRRGYNLIPTEAYEGEKIVIYNKKNSDLLKLDSYKITKKSDGSNVASKLGYNKKKYSFTMPNYAIKVKVNTSRTKNFNASYKKINASLVTYNSINIKHSVKYDSYPIFGNYVYYKKGNSKKYIYYGKVNRNKSLTVKNLKPGKKYTFKLVPYTWQLNYISHVGDTDFLSNKSKTVTIRTLKQMNKPKVKKESSNEVLVKVKEIKGATGYKIAVSKNKDKGYNTIATIKSGENSKVIKAKKGKKLYYKVRAYKKEGKNKVYAPWSKVKEYKLK